MKQRIKLVWPRCEYQMITLSGDPLTTLVSYHPGQCLLSVPIVPIGSKQKGYHWKALFETFLLSL